MSIYTEIELKKLGFAHTGKNVRVSSKASFYGIDKISIGDNVRIDDFCVLSAGVGGINIGSHIHIGVYSSIIGAGAVTLKDFCNISSRVSIYSSNDNYSGEYMTSPMVDKRFSNVSHAAVNVGKHVIIGCSSVILPGVSLGQGVAVGALSLVTQSLEPWGIYVGQPAKYVKKRSRQLLKLEQQFILNQENK